MLCEGESSGCVDPNKQDVVVCFQVVVEVYSVSGLAFFSQGQSQTKTVARIVLPHFQKGHLSQYLSLSLWSFFLSLPLPLPLPPQVLELACARESDKVYDAGGLPAATALLIHHSATLHKDTAQSCMSMVTRLVPRVEPKDSALEDCVQSLSLLLHNPQPYISDPTLKCFTMLADRFIRRGQDPAPIAEKGLLPELIGRLKSLGGGSGPSSSASSSSGPVGTTPDRPSGHTVTTIVSLLSTLCRGSPTITNVGCGA